MNSYRTHGTCSRQINYEVEDGILKNVEFIGDCAGNAKGVSKLAINRDINEVISLLEGIQCRGGTSCPDQLARALKEYKVKSGN